MTAPDLETEFSAACCNIDGARLAELLAAGIRTHRVDGAQLVGSMPIETYRSGLYEPRDDGALAVLAPCGTWDGLSWQLDDVVAFELAHPARWWRRRGDARVLSDRLHFAIELRRLHHHPLDWLKDGGRGLVVLDWAANPVDLLFGAGELVADRFLLNRLRKTAINAAVAQLDRIVIYG